MIVVNNTNIGNINLIVQWNKCKISIFKWLGLCSLFCSEFMVWTVDSVKTKIPLILMSPWCVCKCSAVNLYEKKKYIKWLKEAVNDKSIKWQQTFTESNFFIHRDGQSEIPVVFHLLLLLATPVQSHWSTAQSSLEHMMWTVSSEWTVRACSESLLLLVRSNWGAWIESSTEIASV